MPCSSPADSRTASASRFTHGMPSSSAPSSPASRSTARSTDTVVCVRASSTIGCPARRASSRACATMAGSRPSRLAPGPGCSASAVIGVLPAGPDGPRARRAGPRTSRGRRAPRGSGSGPAPHDLVHTRCRSAWSHPRPCPRRPARRRVNEVAMEKKITVPPWAVASTAPPSQPGTSTQTTVTSAGPPAAGTAAAGHRVAGVGDHDLVGEPGPAPARRPPPRPGPPR